VSGGSSSATVTPALVQFAMLPEAARDLGRTVRVEQTLERVTIHF